MGTVGKSHSVFLKLAPTDDSVMRVVVKIMVLFWFLSIIWQLVFRGPKKRQ